MLQSMMGVEVGDVGAMNMFTTLMSPDGNAPTIMSRMSFTIGRRDVGASTAAFRAIQSPVNVNQSGRLVEGQGPSMNLVMTDNSFDVKLSGVTRLDGEYVVLVSMAPGRGEFEKSATTSNKTSGAVRLGNGIVWGSILLCMGIIGTIGSCVGI
jgi:hypothetical protein